MLPSGPVLVGMLLSCSFFILMRFFHASHLYVLLLSFFLFSFVAFPPPQFSCVLSIFFSYFVSLILSLFLSLSCFSSFRIFLPLIPFTNFYLSFFFILGFSFAFHSSIACSSSSSSISLFLYSFSSHPATSSMNADSSSSGSSP